MKTPIKILLAILAFCLFAAIAIGTYYTKHHKLGLDQPNHTTEEILQWSNKSINSILNDRENNYENSSKYFTTEGWKNFQTTFTHKKIDDFNFSVMSSEKLKLVKEGIDDKGRYFWQVEMPISVTALDSSEFSNQQSILQITVVRIPVIAVNQLGIAINEWTYKNQEGILIKLFQ